MQVTCVSHVKAGMDAWRALFRPILIDIMHLRAGVDLLRVTSGPLKGRTGVYRGFGRGVVMVELAGGVLDFDPSDLTEPTPIPSNLNYWEVIDGFFTAADVLSENGAVGTKTLDRIPTDFSRGFAYGYRNVQREGFLRTFGEIVAYNSCARECAALAPNEYNVGALPRPVNDVAPRFTPPVLPAVDRNRVRPRMAVAGT